MTDTPDLRDQIAQLVGVIQHELELARAGEGYEEPAVAEEIVAKCVAPLLAAKDQRADALSALLRGMARRSVRNLKLLDAAAPLVDQRTEERDEARAEVERLRAELAEALEVAERAARDTGQRTPLERVIAEELADFGREEDLNDDTAPAAAARVMRAIQPAAAPSSGLAGLAAPDTTEPCWCSSCAPTARFADRMHLCPTCGSKRCPRAMHHDAPCTASDRKPRRDERINPTWLYTEPTDHGGA